MRKIYLAVIFVLGWLTSASAQAPIFCPTRPASDSSNACATTAFVQNAFAQGSINNLLVLGTITQAPGTTFSLANGAFISTPSGNGAFEFLAQGVYKDNTVTLQNTTSLPGVQCGNASIRFLDATGLEQSAIYYNRFVASCGGSNSNQGFLSIGIGSISGSAGNLQKPTWFGITVANNAFTTVNPNKQYNIVDFRADTNFWFFRDMNNDAVMTLDLVGHVVQINGVRNFLNMSGGNTVGESMTFSVGLGSVDPDVGISFAGKGSGAFLIASNGQTALRVYNSSASAVNNIDISGTTAGAGPLIIANGSDANIDINFSTKAAGLPFFSTASNWAANAAVATAMSAVGPTGSHTTIQEWFVVKSASGATRYIPAF